MYRLHIDDMAIFMNLWLPFCENQSGHHSLKPHEHKNKFNIIIIIH